MSEPNEFDKIRAAVRAEEKKKAETANRARSLKAENGNSLEKSTAQNSAG